MLRPMWRRLSYFNIRLYVEKVRFFCLLKNNLNVLFHMFIRVFVIQGNAGLCCSFRPEVSSDLLQPPSFFHACFTSLSVVCAVCCFYDLEFLCSSFFLLSFSLFSLGFIKAVVINHCHGACFSTTHSCILLHALTFTRTAPYFDKAAVVLSPCSESHPGLLQSYQI